MKPTLNEQLARMQTIAGIISENQDHYKDAEKDDAAHIDALEKDMKDDAKKTSEGKMTKSDLKSKIKEMILAELNEDSTEDIDEPGALNNMYDPLAEAEEEVELEDNNYDAEFLFKYFKNKGDLFMDEMREYDAEELMNSYPGLSEEEAEKLEDMLQNLAEAKKDEEVEDVTVDDTEVVDAPESDMMAGETAEVSGIQSNLQAAYAEAKALGDEKLITQIANTITYFTKAHILDTAPVNENMFPMLKRILK
jgi:ribosomal protein S20